MDTRISQWPDPATSTWERNRRRVAVGTSISRRLALRLSAAVTAGAAGPLAGAACGPGGPAAGPGGQGPRFSAQQRYKISYWHWGTQEYYDRERRTADKFQQKFPNVEVEVVLQATGFQDKISAAFAGGAPPDVHVLDMQVVQDWGKRNVLVDLKQFLKGERTITLAFYERSPLTRQALDIMSYKDQVLGLPGEAGPNLYYYNADLFRRNGLKTPFELWKEDKWTWEAFAESLSTIARASGVTGAAAGLHRLWMNAAGGKEFDDVKAPRRCLYDDPGSIDGLTFLQDLRHKFKLVPVDFTREVGDNDTNAFVAGKVAMMARWTTGVGVYKGIKDFKWGMVPYPRRKTYANDYATSGPAIAKDSKAIPAAWEWVKFRQGPEGGLEHATDGYALFFHAEPRKVVQETHRSIPTLETPTAMFDMLEGGKHSFVRLLSVDQAKIHGELINPELNKIWRNEEAAASVAKRIAASVNEFLKNNPQ